MNYDYVDTNYLHKTQRYYEFILTDNDSLQIEHKLALIPIVFNI